MWEAVTLKSWISRNPNVLGNEVLSKWGCDLPFLFKVLSVGKALSRQAHPDKELAETLHELQPNIYMNGNHKPEMALALTDFEALHGFIGLKSVSHCYFICQELKDVLCGVPEIVELIGKADAEQVLRANEHVGEEKVKAVLEFIFTQLMSSNKDTISELIFKIKPRLNMEKELVLRLEGQYPTDVGVIASPFLNHVKLNSGFLGANEPNAYIPGECTECMATLDNVVRAGLTSKHQDIQILFSMLTYQQGFPEILVGVSMNPYTKRYLPPFDEFEVDCCILPQAASVVFPSVPGPSPFLIMAGKGTIHAGFAGEHVIGEGSVLFVPANMEIRIAASSMELQLYRAGVNSRVPKMVVEDDNSEKPLDLFLKIGLDERTARNTIANNKVTANLTAVIHEAALTNGCNRTVGNLLYTVATKFPANALVHRPTLLQYIVSSKIKTPAQLEAAFSFYSSIGSENFELKEFEESCGVGIDVPIEDIERTVNEIFEESKNVILGQRYQTNGIGVRAKLSNRGISIAVCDLGLGDSEMGGMRTAICIVCLSYLSGFGDLFGHVRKSHPWADPKIVKVAICTLFSISEINVKLYGLLGEKTAADDEKPSRKKKEKQAKSESIAVDTHPPPTSEEELNPFLIFPQPEENFKVHTEIFFSDRPVLRVCNTREMLEKHLKATGGRVFTRFPPEPNGYLHIGHAKAMFVSFGLAKERDGCCYLRYDDTNPEAEKKEYIDHIDEIVRWMGWEPFKVTYTSDYFQDLYDLAVELIRRNHAYVDHQTPEEIKEYREKKMNSPWRDRPIAESLELFDQMRRGMIEEGKATLRMKQDMQSDNYNMYDLIAYRIKASANL
ncbi:Glutamine--tRNA ligase, cytoplasmic [Vitis vinifera]|uniref:mannose-6-phosphate isomerase n=1 Tax=Vitis vinifera TaxID=29760 RepID=A0A438JUD7_VITVI|nr:Glutamine--tRNA ligase, cytoplasmic [Vitis vinifera]